VGRIRVFLLRYSLDVFYEMRLGDNSLTFTVIVDLRPGCGGYADNESGAVSTTGHGESIMRTCLAKHVATLMAQGNAHCYALLLY
jgi:hypothetical protein